MQDDMLWIYEGLTEYLGYVLTARSGLQSPDEFRDSVAAVASVLEHKSGRTWRPLQDTATMAGQLYNAPGEWSNYRRGVDFYDEGVLLWLEVDTIIRQQSNGAKSIEDFCHIFHGPPSTPPMVKPYTFDDVVSALDQVAAYDWRAFLRSRLDATLPHAAVGGIENAGWRVVYSDVPNVVVKAGESVDKGLDLVNGAGFSIGEDGRIGDVAKRTAADRAGLSPGMALVAVDGRKYSNDVLREALAHAKSSNRPIELIVQNGEYFRTISLDYKDGVRYAHLERDTSKPDVLSEIMKPRTR
jgi:predicted metalloprotease with PDZ domain